MSRVGGAVPLGQGYGGLAANKPQQREWSFSHPRRMLW